jgi:tetratricopeptide (TPR) repeat protein
MKMKLRLMALIFAAALPAGAAPSNQFAKANADYAAGHFREAVDGYEAIVKSGQWNATVFYDLGNAWYRLGDNGRAILNYERALMLDHAQPEAEANLRVVRDQARALELAKTWRDRAVEYCSEKQWTWMAAGAFWTACFLAAGLWFSRRRMPLAMAALVLCIAISAAATGAVWTGENGSRGAELAIVTAKEVPARLATADSANSVLVLPSGSEITILSVRGDWIYAGLPNGLRGWMPANSAERVRL